MSESDREQFIAKVAAGKEVLTWKNEDEKENLGLKMRRKLYENEKAEGTLAFKVGDVLKIDDKYAFDIVMNMCGLGEGPLKDKHIILIEPRPPFIAKMLHAVNRVSCAFMHMDSRGILRMEGKTLNDSMKRTFIAVSQYPDGVTISELLENQLKGESLQTCSSNIRFLYSKGFFSREDIISGKGRPLPKYSVYWPPVELDTEFDHFPSHDISWEVYSPELDREIIIRRPGKSSKEVEEIANVV